MSAEVEQAAASKGTKRRGGDPSFVPKRQRSHGELLSKINVSLWGETLSALDRDQRRSKVQQVLDQATADILPQLVLKHDGSRIIELCLKFGSPEQKEWVLQQLKGKLVHLSSDKYGRHVVLKLIKYGNAAMHREVFEELRTRIRRLAVNKDAAEVVDFFWRECASEREKRLLMRAWYGREFELEIFEEKKEDLPVSLKELIAGVDEAKAKVILGNLRKFVSRLNEKGIASTSMAHTALNDYFENASLEDCTTLAAELNESILALCQTREGVKAAVTTIALSSAKDRKVIVKSLKGHIAEMAVDGDGFLFLAVALLVIDDTTLSNKFVSLVLLCSSSELARLLLKSVPASLRSSAVLMDPSLFSLF
jgi:pumilio family protein 6